jgi:dihydroxy-acid dehydratase
MPIGESVALVTDGRFSAAPADSASDTCPLKRPRAVPSGLIQEGDIIAIDLAARQLDVEVDQWELERRAGEWQAPAPKFTRGWLARYAALVTSAHTGAVLAVPPAREFAPKVAR